MRIPVAVLCAQSRVLARRLALLLALFSAGPASADLGFVKVIPPGTESLFSKMLDVKLPGDCKLESADIDRTRVVATFRCPGKPDAVVELRHPDDATGATSFPRVERTAKFALLAGGSVPAPLLLAITREVAAHEAGFRWVSAEAPGLGTIAHGVDGTDGPTPTSAVGQRSGFTPEQSEAFVAAVALYRAGRQEDAFNSLMKLARDVPQNGVLGMLVASLASTSPRPARADQLAAAADAHPDDTLAQFVAGVGAHYAGHLNGATRQEKAQLYRRAIKYLERTRPKFDFEPRVYVYLAISHFRLGEQAEAEALIDKAIPLATNDPDVYYCRAEISQGANVKRSVEDIRKYLQMVATLHAQGVPVSETKQARVKAMLDYLEAVARGDRKPIDSDDYFDPLPGADPTVSHSSTTQLPTQLPSTGSAPPASHATSASSAPLAPSASPNRLLGSPRSFANAVLALLLVAGIASLVAGRKPKTK